MLLIGESCFRYIALNTGLHSNDKSETVEDRKHVSSGGSTFDLAKSYFSRLDTSQVQALYEYYKFDFEAFGYDHREFYATDARRERK
jgi:hypothetical protein